MNQAKEGRFPPPRGDSFQVQVNKNQRGNPLLKHIKQVGWTYAEPMNADYMMGPTTCALFLGMRYHIQNPTYIQRRITGLGNSFDLRVLIVLADHKDNEEILSDLSIFCVMNNLTMLCVWSYEEAGRYIETYKSYDKKSADLIKEKIDNDHCSRVMDCLTSIKRVNKTDCLTLMSTFGSLKAMMGASKQQLAMLPGFGDLKAQRVFDCFRNPFVPEIKPTIADYFDQEEKEPKNLSKKRKIQVKKEFNISDAIHSDEDEDEIVDIVSD